MEPGLKCLLSALYMEWKRKKEKEIINKGDCIQQQQSLILEMYIQFDI